MGFLDFIGIDDDALLWLFGGLAVGVLIFTLYNNNPFAQLAFGGFSQNQSRGVSNAEQWSVERDDVGRLTGVTIHRNVSV